VIGRKARQAVILAPTFAGATSRNDVHPAELRSESPGFFSYLKTALKLSMLLPTESIRDNAVFFLFRRVIVGYSSRFWQ
jgi:hypothetical protein